MDQRYIPFIPTNFGSFLLLVIVFEVLGGVAIYFPLCHAQWQRGLNNLKWWRRKLFYSKVVGQEIKGPQATPDYFLDQMTGRMEAERSQEPEPPLAR